jgi:flagellar hook-basal body complex protein FliE
LLENGVNDVNAKLMQSDQLVRAFALDDSIPVHQVTYALEQSRLSLELMMQVRNRLIDSYQQLMNMQL